MLPAEGRITGAKRTSARDCPAFATEVPQPNRRNLLTPRGPNSDSAEGGGVSRDCLSIDGVVRVFNAAGRLLGTESFKPGDDVEVIARGLLRAKQTPVSTTRFHIGRTDKSPTIGDGVSRFLWTCVCT